MMDRRKFIQVSAAGSLLSTAAQAAGRRSPITTLGAPLTIGSPAVMAPRTSGVDIIWRIRGLAKGYVEYGETKDLGNRMNHDGWGLRPAGTEAIRVTINDLKPGTIYYYRVITENFDHKNPVIEKSDIRTFKTLSEDAASTTFSVWNDTHKHNSTIKRLADLTPQSDFLIWNGDTCNDWYRKEEVADTLITPGKGIDITAKCPLFILRGNHDIRGTLAYQVSNIAATPSGKPWFAFRSGPVAAICLDTGEDKPDDHPHLHGRAACEPMRQEQAQWLKTIIQQPAFKDAPYRIVFCHIPLRWTNETKNYGYDYYSKRSRDLWHDSLVQWGAQLIISGHTHRSTYLPPQKNFPYAQLIGGGPKMHQALLILGKADASQLTINLTNMSGKNTKTHTFKPLI